MNTLKAEDEGRSFKQTGAVEEENRGEIRQIRRLKRLEDWLSYDLALKLEEYDSEPKTAVSFYELGTIPSHSQQGNGDLRHTTTWN